MDTPISTTRNCDAIGLRVPHIVGYYTEARHYLTSLGVTYENGLCLTHLLYLLQLTTCQHLMRNHFFLILKFLNLLAPDVAEQLSAMTKQSTNSSIFKRLYGPMPARRLMLKNVRQLLGRYNVDVSLTTAGAKSCWKNMNEVYRRYVRPKI